MTRNTAPKYFQNFQTFVVNKFVKYDEDIKYLKDVVGEHSVQLLDLQEKVDQIDERTAFLPKLYSAVDAFMKEIRESRDDRITLARRVGGHEERLAVVENTLSIKPPAGAF